MNDEIRLRVQQKLAANYPHLTVEVRAALLVDGEGIEIRGVTISDPTVEGPEAELLYFDEIMLACQTDLQGFLQGQPEVQQIRIRRPRMRATRAEDGTWSLNKLLPFPKLSAKRVPAVIEGAIIEVVDRSKPQPATYVLRDCNLEIQPSYAEGDTEATLHLSGSASGDRVERLEIVGTIAPHGSHFSAGGSVTGIDISPELQSSLPAEISSQLQTLSGLRGECSVNFQVEYTPGRPVPLQFAVVGELTRGRLDHARIPQQLTDMQLEFKADNQGAEITKFTARSGNSSFHGTGKIHGLTKTSPMAIELYADRLFIGRPWEEFLTGSIKETWKKFQPAGEINVLAKLNFDGQKWTPDVTVDCLNVSFTYYKFQYRLDRGTGRLTLKDRVLDIHMSADAGKRRISIEGRFDNPGPQFTGWVHLKGTELPLDQNTLTALPEKARVVVQAMNATGSVDAEISIGRNDPRVFPAEHYMKLELNQCSVRYDKFAYPIGDIQGTMTLVNGVWEFKDLKGSNDSGRITCNGFLRPVVEGTVIVGTELELNFGGTEVVLENELRDALPPGARKAWASLNPRGQINLNAQVRYLSASKKLDVLVNGTPLGETVSVEPQFFPYRMEKVGGRFDFREGQVDFTKVNALHERMPIRMSGNCTFDKSGNWVVQFKELTVDRLKVDRDLLAALPGKLRKVVADLNPTGPVHIYDGTLRLKGNSEIPNHPIKSDWDLSFDLRQSALNCGIPIQNIDGTIRLVGECDGQNTVCRGGLNLDSLTYKDFQFTEVRGPLYFDDKQVIFGSKAIVPPEPGRPPSRISAKLYGGKVTADCWVGIGNPCRYVLQASLVDGDLHLLAANQLPGKQSLKGKIVAGIDLSGEGSGMHTLGGRGQVRLREADIYELPVMVALLKILSIREPDRTGFTTSDVDFRIDGGHIYLDRIEFSGDAISLVGQGEMNFDTNIDAALTATVGRSELQLPIFKDMLNTVGQQLLEIRVNGNLSDPQIHRRAFPGINQALKQFGNDLQPRNPLLPNPAQAQAPGQRVR